MAEDWRDCSSCCPIALCVSSQREALTAKCGTENILLVGHADAHMLGVMVHQQFIEAAEQASRPQAIVVQVLTTLFVLGNCCALVGGGLGLTVNDRSDR